MDKWPQRSKMIMTKNDHVWAEVFAPLALNSQVAQTLYFALARSKPCFVEAALWIWIAEQLCSDAIHWSGQTLTRQGVEQKHPQTSKLGLCGRHLLFSMHPSITATISILGGLCAHLQLNVKTRCASGIAWLGRGWHVCGAILRVSCNDYDHTSVKLRGDSLWAYEPSIHGHSQETDRQSVPYAVNSL